MPLYYFDFLDSGGLLVDDEGRELSDLQAVQTEAARSLIDMARDSLLDGAGLIDRIAVQVRGEAGPVMNVGFRFEIEKTN
jgi:hypothetical protein